MSPGRPLQMVAVILALGTAGCGKSSTSASSAPAPPLIKVAYWGGPEEIAIIQGVIQQWQAQHPNVQVRLEHTPFSVYVSRLLTRMAGDIAPDIIATEANLFVNFWAKNALLPLNRFIEQDPGFQLKDFFPEVLNRFTVEGQVYGIPRDTAPFACIYYNKRLFDEAGLAYPTDSWTTDDLLRASQKLTKRQGDQITQYGFYAWAWQNFVYSFGGRIVDDLRHPTRCLLDSPDAIAGLQFYADLMNKYHVAPTPVALGNLAMGAQQLFMGRRVAMFSSGIWETPVLKQIKDFDWDVVMFPKGPNDVRAFGTGGTAYCILKSSPHPEIAWDVLKALAGAEGQRQLAKQGLIQPANRVIAEGPDWADNGALPPANKKMLNQAVQYAVYDPFIPEWREIYELHILPELDLVFNGQQSAAEAVKKIVPKVNAALAGR